MLAMVTPQPTLVSYSILMRSMRRTYQAEESDCYAIQPANTCINKAVQILCV